MVVGTECYSLKSQCMLIMQLFFSFSLFSHPHSSSLFFFFCSHFLCHFPFPVSHSPLHAQSLFIPAIDLLSLLLSPSLAVASQRSEDVILTLHSGLLISCLYLYFCTAVYGSPLPHSDTTLFTRSHSFLQTHLGGLNLQPWRRVNDPWSPWAVRGAGAHGPLPCPAAWLSLMSQWPLLGTSAISHCSLRSLPNTLDVTGTPSQWWQLRKDQSLPFGYCRQLVWACGQRASTEPQPFSGPPALLLGCPCAGYHAPWCLLPLSPKAALCRQGEEETGVLPGYREHAGTRRRDR